MLKNTLRITKALLYKILLAVYIGAALFRITDPNLKWVKEESQIVKKIDKAPTNIKISTLNLDLAISPSKVKENDWEVFDDRVAWLSTSSFPGDGNVILYAHDRIGLFQNLKNIKVGDEIEIYNGKYVTYKVTEVKIVKPNDIESILSNKNRLTLYTCSGSFDQKRLIVYAE